jgi:glycerol-3-phosphate acyltransferase PlsX
MRIALDAMGSDHAPAPDVEGAVRAARRFGVEVTLVGRQPDIELELARHDLSGLSLPIVHATEVVEMVEHPSQAVRAKRDASIVVAMGLLRDGKVDAVVSAGNSGGVLAAALLSAGRIGRLPGIARPAISTVLPTLQGRCFMLDIGANADCKPEWLAQFAIMGAAYADKVLGIANPRVGLLSNGEEDTKGNQVVQEAHALLRQLGLNFVGNVEGKDIAQGKSDVVVSDGFAGNVAVKTAEGTAGMLLQVLKGEIKRRPAAMVGALLARPAFRAVGKVLDYREYGGGPLLGVNGVVIIAHGRSDALAMENAVRVAVEAVQADLVSALKANIASSLGRLAALGADAAGAAIP